LQFKLGEIKTKMAWKYLAAWKKGAIIGALFGCLMIYLGYVHSANIASE